MAVVFRTLGVFTLLCFLSLFPSCATPRGTGSEDFAADYASLGLGFYNSGNREMSIEYFRRAYELNPELPGLRYNYARALLDADETQFGIELLESLSAEDSENLLILEALAYGYLLNNESEKAIRVLDGVRLSLGKVGMFNYLLAHYRGGEYSRGIEVASGLPETWLEEDKALAGIIGILYLYDGFVDEAILLLEYNLDGNQGVFLSYLADAYAMKELYLQEIAIRERLYQQKFEESKQSELLTYRYFIELEDLDSGVLWLRRSIDHGFQFPEEDLEVFLVNLAPSQIDEIRALLEEGE